MFGEKNDSNSLNITLFKSVLDKVSHITNLRVNISGVRNTAQERYK